MYQEEFDRVAAFACFLRSIGENTIHQYNYMGGYYDAIVRPNGIAIIFVGHSVVCTRNNKKMIEAEFLEVSEALESDLWCLIHENFDLWFWADRDIDAKIATLGGVWRHRATRELVLTLGICGKEVRFINQTGEIRTLAKWNNGVFPLTYEWVGNALDITSAASTHQISGN